MRYKYDIFISYSSQDKEIVLALAKNLRKRKYSVWLDEWEVALGGRIQKEIQTGIKESRYLAIWLTPKSVQSNWVELEWQAKHWSEVSEGGISVLPLLGQPCEIPVLLAGRKYANFSESFDSGLEVLLTALEKESNSAIQYFVERLINGDRDADITANRLGDIAIRSNDETALEGLWKAVLETKKPYYVIDHCVYYIDKIMIACNNTATRERIWEMLKLSTLDERDIVIDKMAYTAGEIAIQATNDEMRCRAMEFVEEHARSEKPLVRRHYSYTKRRINETPF